jgi:hypothetical protein
MESERESRMESRSSQCYTNTNSNTHDRYYQRNPLFEGVHAPIYVSVSALNSMFNTQGTTNAAAQAIRAGGLTFWLNGYLQGPAPPTV